MQLLETGPEANLTGGASAWKNPTQWLLEKKLSRSFWVFFAVAFCFDFGFSLYYFLFNLYLLDLHFSDRVIGLVGGALTLGTVVGTLPIGWLARKYGLRFPLACCLIAAPLFGALRTLAMWESAQIGFAFLAGVAMCIWGVCFPPMVAKLTTPENRASAFSLIFSVSIGTSALGGVFSGYLPLWLKNAGYSLQASDVKRMILLGACLIVIMGLIPLAQLKLPADQDGPSFPDVDSNSRWKISPFLLRFLPAMALWTAASASFAPFAFVYLTRDFRISLTQIGVVFSAARVVEFCVGLLTPFVFRMFGLLNGIVATQAASAAALFCLAGTSNRTMAVTLYLSFSATEWMSSPGLYNLLMSKVSDQERSSASATTMFCNAIVQSCAVALAGISFTRFGYSKALTGIAAMAFIAALLFKSFDLPANLKAAPAS